MAEIQPILLTTNEAHEFCAKRVVFEFLRDRYALQPSYIGKGSKTVVWSADAIRHALRQLELSGGWNEETSQPIAQSTP